MISLTDCNELTISDQDATLTGIALVKNATALANYNRYSLSALSADWQVHGQAAVSAVVKTSVSIDKQVTLKGFDNFPEPTVIKNVSVVEGNTDYLKRCILSLFCLFSFVFGR